MSPARMRENQQAYEHVIEMFEATFAKAVFTALFKFYIELLFFILNMNA
jgi:hypothetical protein